jgi:hypothetical protein
MGGFASSIHVILYVITNYYNQRMLRLEMIKELYNVENEKTKKRKLKQLKKAQATGFTSEPVKIVEEREPF